MPERHSGYEADNTAVRSVLVLLLATAILIPLLSFAVWLGMGLVQPGEEASSPLEPGPIPSEQPELQPDPKADFAHWQQLQKARLNSFGWVDRDAGIVHLPIDRAMDLLVERGLSGTGHGHQHGEGSQ